MDMIWMGIDGGGSHLRVVIVDDKMTALARVQGDAANPSALGHDEAARRIQSTVKQALQQANHPAITAAGIGVAGASAEHSADWLRDTLTPVLPGATIYPSSDDEIAMVGGRASLHGYVILAGTGSVAFGRNEQGHRHQAGGWGYLIGDEGSGYWIGAQALRAVTHYGDGRLKLKSDLPQQIMQTIGIVRPVNVIDWTYHEAHPKDVARLAELVLAAASNNDPLAQSIVQDAAGHLVALAEHIRTTLDLNRDTITYAGGLLTSDNAVSRAVTAGLGLAEPPAVHYPPVIGAALLAKLKGK